MTKTALRGSGTVAARIGEYAALGIEYFILSGYPHLEEAYNFAEQVFPHLPRAQASTVAGAGHFAFMAQPTFPLPSPAGDASSNPPGFDRVAFLPSLDSQVAEFFADQWR